MKLVFTREEVAEALGQSLQSFEALLPRLNELGFPKPVRGIEDCWAIMDVIRWINHEPTPTLESVARELEEERKPAVSRARGSRH